MIPAGNAASRLIDAGGLTFEILEQGEGDRLVLCLHGFPSQAICWRGQLPMLASLGYRAWAPSQRGYGRTSRPTRSADYAIDKLLGDIAALIDASGARSTVLIGHDWGGLLAWFFAARRIRPLEKLIILNAPHPAVAAVAYRRWRQMRKAWYMAAFQVPWLPDFLLRFNRAWLLGRLMQFAAGGRAIFPEDVLAVYRRAATEPGATTAMLNWYRGMARSAPPPEVSGRCPIIDTPTLIIWGEADVALDLACLDGLENYVRDLRVERLPGVSHWVQEEAPETVNRLMAGFLAG